MCHNGLWLLDVFGFVRGGVGHAPRWRSRRMANSDCLAETPKPWYRWWQFRLRALLLLPVASGLLLLWIPIGVSEYYSEQRALQELSDAGHSGPFWIRRNPGQFLWTVGAMSFSGSATIEWCDPQWLKNPCDRLGLPVYYRVVNLSLSGADYSDECVAHIIEFQDAQQIDLRYTGMSDEGIERLRRFMPATTVIAEKYKPIADGDQSDDESVDEALEWIEKHQTVGW